MTTYPLTQDTYNTTIGNFGTNTYTIWGTGPHHVLLQQGSDRVVFTEVDQSETFLYGWGREDTLLGIVNDRCIESAEIRTDLSGVDLSIDFTGGTSKITMFTDDGAALGPNVFTALGSGSSASSLCDGSTPTFEGIAWSGVPADFLPPVTPVPLPAAMPMLAAAMIGLWIWNWLRT